MITFNELTYRIFNIIKPKISDDESIDITEIRYDVENARALLLKRRNNKFRTDLQDEAVQSIELLEVESVNASQAYPDVPSDKVLLKTKLQLPNILRKGSGMPMVERISAATTLSANFTFVTAQHAIYSGNGKFNSKNTFAFEEDGYLYFITGRLLAKALKYVNVRAIFERPTEVFDFLNENYSGSYDYSTSAYPVPMDMIDDIEMMVIKNKLRIESSQPIDDINDASDTPKQIGKVSE